VSYKDDLDLHDRSIQFSAEILRLALAGIAVIGYLVVQLPEKLRGHILETRTLLSASLVMFTVSAACALLHRYFAGGAAFHHLQIERFNSRQSIDSKLEIIKEEKLRDKLFHRCHHALRFACWFLAIGTACAGITFIAALR
jgi:hypothetical protein